LTVKQRSATVAGVTEFDAGYVVGLLVGEGHFGGDGRQPHVTLRMHTRHARIFEWLLDRFPESRLYGPYTHGGRSYYQWMARGPFLRNDLVPMLDRYLRARCRSRRRRRWALSEHRDPTVALSDRGQLEPVEQRRRPPYGLGSRRLADDDEGAVAHERSRGA
jgi:hypothetical protein